jgi:hypothetical protein
MTFIFPRGWLSGLILSTAGGSNTFGVTAGQCADSTNAAIMNVAGAASKTTAAWAAGSGNGALDTGSIAASTWYHVFAISDAVGINTDILISTSPTAPSLPPGFPLFRRIGAMLTDGSNHWVQFFQFGDQFLWFTAPNDFRRRSARLLRFPCPYLPASKSRCFSAASGFPRSTPTRPWSYCQRSCRIRRRCRPYGR